MSQDSGTPKRLAISPNVIRRSVLSRRKKLQRTADASDSDESDNESISMTTPYADEVEEKSRKRRLKKSSNDWLIMEGLKDGQIWEDKPTKLDGYLLKRRKWPLKGWHKRFFSLDKGTLTYAKTPSDMQKGKVHGVVDIGLSVISYKHQGHRIDIDSEDIIYHIKVKSGKFFHEWVEALRIHRLSRQHEVAYGNRDSVRSNGAKSPEEQTISPDPIEERRRTLSFQREGSLKGWSNTLIQSGQNRVATWLLDNSAIEQCNKELQSAQSKIFDLTNCLAQMHDIQATSDQVFDMGELLETPSSKSKSSLAYKLRLKGRKEKVKAGANNSDTGSLASLISSTSTNGSEKSSSTNNVSAVNRPLSMPDCSAPNEQRFQEMQIREDFLSTARDVQDSLKGLVRTIGTERDRLKKIYEQDLVTPNNNLLRNSFKQAYLESIKQNQELKNRLAKIQELSSVPESESKLSSLEKTVTPPRLQPSQSLSMDSASIAEFFDASEYLGGPPTSSSSEESEVSEESGDEDEEESSISDVETEATPTLSVSEEGEFRNGRRDKLPAPRADTGDISLWNLLCKNIGKDLSKIAMPVTLNEPLNALQRLCEELEYSDLLDKAAITEDPYDRMVLVAAFAVSAYASSYHRAGQKPFNPLLGETYECIRQDLSWKFVAEQVSHHPPISACHCESKHFTFWQDVRIRNKFWGKSMEIQPVGIVNLKLPSYGEHYSWNKVTSCVHNILSGQRWIDQYGEMVISNGNITCKIVFDKTKYWSSSRHNIHGTVTDSEGNAVRHLFGKWMEGLYCGHAPSARCIWRPGAMPEDSDLYYGFTRFAMELNELSEQSDLLATTDSRHRPDQRLLEEGKIQEAESEKLRVEHLQRQRRKDGIRHTPRWFIHDTTTAADKFVFTGEYWNKRHDPGFSEMDFTKLW